MKALHVVASINREVGGPAVTVSRLAATLAQFGVETSIATLDYARHGPQLPSAGVRIESVAATALTRGLRGWSPRFARKVAALAEAGADVVHNHGLWMFPNYYARRAARARRVPLLVSPRGMLDQWSLRRSRIRKAIAWQLIERENLACAQLFHATSTFEANAIRAARIAQPIAIIPNGVDMPEPAQIPGRERLEKMHAGLAGREWLLFMARLHPKKGLAELLSVWRGLAPRFPDWQLVVAGPDLDGHGADMRASAAACGLSERITFAGMLSGEEKACALANAGLMALPTHSENFGIVVAEALAHGTPAITTHAAPWQELQEARCGWWIEDREEALKEALSEAMSLPPDQRRAMGARGRMLVAERYSWNRIGQEMLAAYNWVCGQGPRPDFVRQ